MSSKAAPNPNPGNGGHPTIERLRDYHQGRLAEADEDRIQEHFLTCSDCRETFLELAEFLDGASGEPRWSVEEMVQEWQKIRASLLAGTRHG